MAKLMRELIHIPDTVHAGDFVLRLTEGVRRPAETLREYVVTPQLAECFAQALRLVRDSFGPPVTSKAAYLHGSFGSGKSHFMAVLHLLLQGAPEARAVPELAPLVAEHDNWLQGKRFLLVPYHMIGAKSMESAILGGYAARVAELHPGAPPPPVYLSQEVFANARRLRADLGEQVFLDQLNRGGEAAGGWGSIAAAWDSAAVDAAMAEPPGEEAHDRLLRDLIRNLFPAFADIAAGEGTGFVSLDAGLAAMSRHAKELGYDGLVLFLDELVLWLASQIGNWAFVQREAPKVAKLVEAADAGRPIPVVSFVARQRDLRELVGERIPGAERLGFADALKWWEGRFETITLEDRNLAAIAARRLLRPNSEAARQEIDAAFERTRQVREEVWRTLLTEGADPERFRQTYPFSPAFMDTLVAVSGALQRERTALKVMLQLLVDQRDTLALGDLVPVGDLYDVIARGDEPLTQEMGRHFDNARRLYARKMRPLFVADGDRGDDGEVSPAFRADDRIAKTLLLSALVPEVAPLRALTPARLAALNHGTITSPIAGEEATVVLAKVRRIAEQVGEVRVSAEANPTISVQLTGVDTEGILAKAREERLQTHANRRRLVAGMVLDALAVPNEGQFMQVRVPWRGTERTIDLLVANVRDRDEVTDDQLVAAAGQWKLVVDLPFDREGHTPADDLARLEDFTSHHPSTRTVCWIPAFMTDRVQGFLDTLILLDHVLASDERFSAYAADMSGADRGQARVLLENQQAMLRQRVRDAVDQAYGIQSPGDAVVPGWGPGDMLRSLDTSFTPAMPPAVSLRAAAEALAGLLN